MAGSLAQSGLAPELVRLVSYLVFESDESGYGVVAMRSTFARCERGAVKARSQLAELNPAQSSSAPLGAARLLINYAFSSHAALHRARATLSSRR